MSPDDVAIALARRPPASAHFPPLTETDLRQQAGTWAVCSSLSCRFRRGTMKEGCSSFLALADAAGALCHPRRSLYRGGRGACQSIAAEETKLAATARQPDSGSTPKRVTWSRARLSECRHSLNADRGDRAPQSPAVSGFNFVTIQASLGQQVSRIRR
jgi:hypothetical protein